MKKLMIAAAIVCAAACANAEQSLTWMFYMSGAVTGTDGTGLWSGNATIACEALGFSTTCPFVDGVIPGGVYQTTILGEVDTIYDFELSMTEGEYVFSRTKSARTDGTGFGNITFLGGNGWTAAPEPTSALLMLHGMAGLCLRRKQRV